MAFMDRMPFSVSGSQRTCERIVEHLRKDRDENDRDAVIADVAINPIHELQDRQAEPLHREPAPLAGDRKAPEVQRALESVRLKPADLFRSDVQDRVTFPGLAGRDRRARTDSHRDLRRLFRLRTGPGLAGGDELEPAALRDDRGEIPGAADTDPLSVDELIADRRHV